MMTMQLIKLTILTVIALGIPLVLAGKTFAHCDTSDGPVVAAAKLALQKGDVTPVLKWVNKDGEKEVREAFAVTMKVRSHGGDAQQLADRYFFETVIRVHRAGEGLPYTGLKPTGTIEPVILAADKSLEQGSANELAADIAKAVQEEIQKRFTQAVEKKKHAEESVEAGRAYVEAYVGFVHFVESIHSLATEGSEAHGHSHKSAGHNE